MSKEAQLEKEQFLADMERITQLVRASKGLPPEAQDAISNLINVKSDLERSRFPTYNILQLIVYLKLIAYHYGKPAELCGVWAKFLMEGLIEYKGQGRDEWVEAVKRTEAPDQTSFTFGAMHRQQAPKPKRHWWQRKPKEETEFVEA